MAESKQPSAETLESQRAAADAAAADQTAEGEVERLRTDLEEAGDRLLRAQAELENYRKRARRELEDERKYALLPLLRDLLPVLDNMDRAIEAAEKHGETGSLLEGIKLVRQSLLTTLNRYNVRPIEAQNTSFDPAFHEAIAQQPSADHPPGTVIQVVQDGYALYDRVVRPARVIVSSAASPA